MVDFWDLHGAPTYPDISRLVFLDSEFSVFLKDMGFGWIWGYSRFFLPILKQYPVLFLDVKMNAVYPEQNQRHDSGDS